MNWVNFPIFALISVILWIIGVIVYYYPSKYVFKDKLANIIISLGIGVLGIFIVILWINLDRPPLRTLGETRLWYSFFLPLVGLLTYLRWKYKWFISYSLGLSILFLILNYIHPENYSKTLMPALQSPWFIPHVIVYIFSYALLAASAIVAVYGLYLFHFKTNFKINILNLSDNMVYLGFGFLTLGLLFGALWAKEAWGHYWTWDPKETWAFLTWMVYLIYIHYRKYHIKKINGPLWTLALAFVVLLIAWFGINYLPSAQSSVHTY
ncbi:MAG: cytochrome c biogenesis protein CcsA [Bacteroidales bacterium]|nr:cytochrome c biogenesis protein CcsA [Bacteroidales bacterium]